MSNEQQGSSSPSGPYRSLSPSSIRLLRLQPAKSLEALLVATFDEIKLDNRATYEALSYAWDGAFPGDNLPDGQLFLGGCLVTIKGNLRDALRRLRGTIEARMIWADAVCINQDDITERSAQVSIMAEIYSQAAQVIMWVGEDSANGDGRVFIRHCSRASRSYKRRDNTRRGHFESRLWRVLFDENRIPAFLKDNIQKFRMNSPVYCLRPSKHYQLRGRFKERLYFTRRWCIQEVAFGKKVLLVCGAHDMPLDVLEDIIHYSPLSFFDFPSIPRLQQLSEQELGSGACMLSLLETCKQHHCRNERDYIYSLVSLLKLLPDCPDIAIDYELEWTTVFARFARDFIKANGFAEAWTFLQIVGMQCRHHRVEKRHAGLPSWVPDWRLSTWKLSLIAPSIAGSTVIQCSETTLQLPLAYYGMVSAMSNCHISIRERESQDLMPQDRLYGLDPTRDAKRSDVCLVVVRDCGEGEQISSLVGIVQVIGNMLPSHIESVMIQ